MLFGMSEEELETKAREDLAKLTENINKMVATAKLVPSFNGETTLMTALMIKYRPESLAIYLAHAIYLLAGIDNSITSEEDKK